MDAPDSFKQSKADIGKICAVTELVRYDAMCLAIDAAYEVDEIKEIRDKALAMETYFRVAKNPEPERQACEIRIRAERKAGSLLSAKEKSGGGQPKKNSSPTAKSSYAQTLTDNDISDNQSAKWQQLANVSSDEFEAAFAGDKTPSTSSIIRKKKQSPMDPDALWLWGRLRDFERKDLLGEDPADVYGEMTDAMKADTIRLIPLVTDWLLELTHER